MDENETKSSKEKERRRLEKNRIAARLSRQRHKEYVKNLEISVDLIRSQMITMYKQKQDAQSEIQRLNNMVNFLVSRNLYVQHIRNNNNQLNCNCNNGRNNYYYKNNNSNNNYLCPYPQANLQINSAPANGPPPPMKLIRKSKNVAEFLSTRFLQLKSPETDE